jgi:prostaglandin reductase 1
MKMKAKRWILANHFDGFPKEDDLKLVEEDLPELKDNEVLLKACYLSVDPYMRLFAPSLSIGSTMIGEQVAQ